jgi:hypothetical protein
VAREKLPPDLIEPLPIREELQALAHEYRHLQNEHKRAAEGSSRRRKIEERLLDVRERFDRALDEWVPDEELRRAWTEYLHYDAPAPDGPPPIRPLVFYGVTEAGSVVEVRGRKEDELEVWVDGSLFERIDADKDLLPVTPPAVLRFDGFEAEERFTASPDAIEALADFLDDGKPPPWDHAPELLADGLIDIHFAVTPRGRRALAQTARG